MSLNLPPCPPSIKAIQHFLKTASEHETRDPVITYWSRLAALQNGMTLDKSSKEALAVLLPLMDWLESTKKSQSGNETFVNEVVASAHVENHAMKLFLFADKEDREGRFNKNVVKAFYTSGILFDVLSVFGELTPENSHYKKYAKLKAAYIHNCLKNGETPIPGPLDGADSDDTQEGSTPGAGAGAPSDPAQPLQPPPPADINPYTNPTPFQNTGGQQPYTSPVNPPAPVIPPTQQFQHMNVQPPPSGGGSVKLSVDQVTKAQKYCKYAISSLDYEDMPTAVLNLQKALHLCKTGREMQ